MPGILKLMAFLTEQFRRMAGDKEIQSPVPRDFHCFQSSTAAMASCHALRFDCLSTHPFYRLPRATSVPV